jgi:acyl-CoA synthetase (AMP-forming)/AMP-acid ligase II
VGGFNVSPAEVEQVMARHPDISEVAVVGVADPRLGEVARAYVIAAHGKTPSESQVIEWCRERLANFKVPRSVAFVEALPRNASGKVLKRELRAQAGEPGAAPAAPGPAS